MSDVVSKTFSGVKELGEGLLSTGKEIAPATVEVVKSPNTLMKTTGIALMGGITGGIVGGILTALPFGMLGRFGGLLKTVTTFSVGAGLLSIGMKKKGSDFGTALIVAGGATTLIGIGQIAAMTGFGPLVGLSNFVQRAEGTLKGYETIDSVEVDKSSYQPTQNYGAEGMTDEEMANDERVKVLIDSELADACSVHKKFEFPKKWGFVAPFTAANNMLTPKMSIRRHKVVEAYEDVIADLYGEDPVMMDAVKKAA